MNTTMRGLLAGAALMAAVSMVSAQPVGGSGDGQRGGPMSGCGPSGMMGDGHGPGMMGGGHGAGMMGDGHGTGMMGGGYGAGMMGDGHGPGMMGGGYGAGMMGGGHGAGMMGGGQGPGMMGGGQGPGMMGGYGMGRGFGSVLQRQLDLGDDQRKQIDAIHDELVKSHFEMAGRMHAEMASMREAMLAQPRDRAALEGAFRRMNALREQRFAAMLAAQDRIDAVLTPEQRTKLHRSDE